MSSDPFMFKLLKRELKEIKILSFLTRLKNIYNTVATDTLTTKISDFGCEIINCQIFHLSPDFTALKVVKYENFLLLFV